jgi:hypothetical protein
MHERIIKEIGCLWLAWVVLTLAVLGLYLIYLHGGI